MNNFDARKYSISIRFSNFEGENCYEAKIQELPSITEYADTHEEAYALAIDSVETLAELYAEQGKAFPEPLQNKEIDYSGRVTLRIPRSLHQSLAMKAEEESVSLNALMMNILASYVGFGAQFKHTTENWQTLANNTHAMKSTAKVHNIRDYQSPSLVNG